MQQRQRPRTRRALSWQDHLSESTIVLASTVVLAREAHLDFALVQDGSTSSRSEDDHNCFNRARDQECVCMDVCERIEVFTQFHVQWYFIAQSGLFSRRYQALTLVILGLLIHSHRLLSLTITVLATNSFQLQSKTFTCDIFVTHVTFSYLFKR